MKNKFRPAESLFIFFSEVNRKKGKKKKGRKKEKQEERKERKKERKKDLPDEALHGEGEEDSLPGERGGRTAAGPGGRRSTPWGG